MGSGIAEFCSVHFQKFGHIMAAQPAFEGGLASFRAVTFYLFATSSLPLGLTPSLLPDLILFFLKKREKRI